MKTRILISIFIFIFLILIYTFLFIALMYNFEGKEYSIIDGIYWVVATITTVGYGDIHFTSSAGKIFSVVVMVSGVLFFFGFFVPYVVIPWAEQRLRLVIPTEMSGLKRHFVICGYNRFTKELCKILEEFGANYVVLEKSVEKVREAIEEGIKCVYSDASLSSFERNGIKDSIAVIVAWENIEDIVDTLLTLRNHELKKYVVYGDYRHTRYLLYAGATKVFLPKSLIASSIARMILREVQIGKMKEVLRGIFTAEIILPKTVPVSEFESKGVKIISACKMGHLEFNPPKNRVLEKGCVALVAGTKDALKEIMYEGSHLRLR
ncbi:potassium channel family protein [Archaeoglobus sp.]